MANDVPITGSIRPIPQQPTLGAIARALAAANQFASRPFGYNNPPGAMLSELVGIPALQRTVEDLSYGFPVTTGAGGLGGTTRLTPDALESAMAVAPLAQVAGRGVNRAAMKAGDVAVQAITRNPQATAMGVLQEAGQMAPLASVIKPKGGNWLAGRVEGAVEPLKTRVLGSDPAKRLRDLDAAYQQNLDAGVAVDPAAFDRERARLIPEAAVNSWLDKKLTNYIRNEMATPEDSLRLQADEFAGRKAKLLAEKDKQLEKATADLERAQAERGVPPEVLTRSQARIRELKRERDYIEAQTGLHFTPEQAQGVGPRNRMEAEKVLRRAGASDEQNVARAYAESDVAKAWENTSDATVNPAAAGDYLNLARSSGYDLMMQKNPWLAKVPPETPVYEPVISHYRDELGFGHLADELRNAMNPASGLPEKLLLTPDKLQKMSVAQAVKHVDDINAWRAVQEREANAARAANAATSVVKEYPEQGLRWVELKLPDEIPGEEMAGALGETYRSLSPEAQAAVREDFMKSRGRAALEDALKYEGEMLSHCVGGYCNEVLSGRSRIMSLRDAEGRPRVTVELTPPNKNMMPYDYWYDRVGKDSPEVKEFLAWAAERKPERGGLGGMYEQWAKETGRPIEVPPTDVAQIKSKGNKLAAEEDIPYVLDFLNSQPLGRVSDLPKGVVDIQNYRGSLVDTAQELFGKRFLTDAEMDQVTRLDMAKSLAPPPPKEQRMLQGFYRGYAGENAPAGSVYVTPQRAVGEHYALKRAEQTGQEPHLEMVLADPFAGRAYGHAPRTRASEPTLVTKARELKPEDVKSRTKLYAEGGAVDGEGDDQRGVDRMVQMEQGGSVQFNPDEIAQLASQFTSQFTPGYAAGGAVKYDPSEIEQLVAQMREEFYA